jgi:large subunit ribosomal protein L15
MRLNSLKKIKGNKSKSKRLGRGFGSGKGGHTVGRGSKGQKARSKIPFGFEGGQIPLYKKMPQIGGFRSFRPKRITHVSLSDFNVFSANTVVEPKDLVEKGVIKKAPKHGVKILANGEIEKKITFKGFLTSESAKKKIEKAGCTLK